MWQWVGDGFYIDLPPRSDLIVPFFKNYAYPMGVIGFVILSYLVIVGTSNAVNLTDGLDGLAIMPAALVGAALGIFAYVVGRADFSKYLLFPYIPGAGEVGVICGAIAGAGLDVYEHEPHVPEALRALDNVTLLPHLGTAALEVRTAMGLMALDNLIACAEGRPLPNPVA